MAYEILSINAGRGPRSYECYNAFLRSCDRHSLRPTFLKGEWRGMTSKIKFLWDYLSSNAHTGRYVLFCDSYDLVFGNPSLKRPNDLWPTLIERFHSFGVPFVANAEKNCFPFAERREQFESFVPKGCTSPFRYLNSGFMLAETEAMVEVLRWIKSNSPLLDDYPDARGQWQHPADQEEYQAAFLAQPALMSLDYEGHFCTATHDVRVEELRSFSTWNGIHQTPAIFHRDCSSTGPMAWHFNGLKDHGVMSIVRKALKL